MTTIKTSIGVFCLEHLQRELKRHYSELLGRDPTNLAINDLSLHIVSFMSKTYLNLSEYLYTEECIQDAKDRIDEIRSLLSEMREDDSRRESLNEELRFLCHQIEKGDMI